jgi:hypothetical protein
MLVRRHDYWRIHENQPPDLDIRHIPLFFEGRFYPGVQIKVGRYYTLGAFVPIESEYVHSHYERVTDHLRYNGAIKPYEWAGYPYYHDDRVEYIRYTPESYNKYRLLIPSIRAGFEIMLAKKRVGVLCRSLPQDCEQIIKEFLLPIPRNKAYHLHY